MSQVTLESIAEEEPSTEVAPAEMSLATISVATVANSGDVAMGMQPVGVLNLSCPRLRKNKNL